MKSFALQVVDSLPVLLLLLLSHSNFTVNLVCPLYRYGVEFVTYILRRLWFQRCTDAWLRRQNVTTVFERHYNNLEKNTVA